MANRIEEISAQYSTEERELVLKVFTALVAIYGEEAPLMAAGMSLGLSLAFRHPEYARKIYPLVAGRLFDNPPPNSTSADEILIEMVPVEEIS